MEGPMRIRRVNVLGLSCSGKTSFSLYLATELRRRNIAAEILEEPFKKWAYELRRLPDAFDQVSAFYEQMKQELYRLEQGVPVVINDSGLCTMLYYAEIAKKASGQTEITGIATEMAIEVLHRMCLFMDTSYPTVNLVLPPLWESINKSQVSAAGRWSVPSPGEWDQFQQFLSSSLVEDYIILPHRSILDLEASAVRIGCILAEFDLRKSNLEALYESIGYPYQHIMPGTAIR